jgi:hypothetical protein
MFRISILQKLPTPPARDSDLQTDLETTSLEALSAPFWILSSERQDGLFNTNIYSVFFFSVPGLLTKSNKNHWM